MKRNVSALTGALAALLLAGPARAADTPFDFNVTPGITSPSGNWANFNNTLSPNYLRLFSASSTGSYLQLTNEPTDPGTGKSLPFGSGSGATTINLTHLFTISSAPRGFPDTMTGTPTVLFDVKLSDTTYKLAHPGASPSLYTHDFLYAVQFQDKTGVPGPGLSRSSTLVDAVITPQGNFTDVLVGSNFYTLSNPSYADAGPPSTPGTANQGTISVLASVRSADVQKAPEPSTMVLSCVGLSFLGLVSWRKRRLKAAPLAA
jgi:hypothetical protein